MNPTIHQHHASETPAPPLGRPRLRVSRPLLPAAAILSGLLAVTQLSGCASTGRGAPVETGEIAPGGTYNAAQIDYGVIVWELDVGESDIDISIGDTSVVLRGYGSQHTVRYTHRPTDPPEFTLTVSGRPEVWWHGYTLKVGALVHDLGEPGTYVLMPDGELRSE